MNFKYDYCENYSSFQVVHNNELHSLQNFSSAYSRKRPITEAKKKDLVQLCKEGLIPEELHHWFNTLPVQSEAEELISIDDTNIT